MSRRRARTEDYAEIVVNPERVLTEDVAWTDPIGPDYPGWEWWQWQEAFAATTLDVVEHVWRQAGAKIYAAHRDKLLRDDLRSWLMVTAQELANKYTPKPWTTDPERYWGGYLYKTLLAQARWHFGQVVGHGTTRAEAVRIHAAGGVVSTDFLDELEELTGQRVERRSLHGYDPLTADPARVVIHLEDLARENRDIERYLRASGTYSTATVLPFGRPCLINLCTRPARKVGLCQSHYNAERTAQSGRQCNIPGCEKPHKSRGLCAGHDSQYRQGRLPAEYGHLVESPRPGGRKPGEGAAAARTGCDVEGCERPHEARGLCKLHYDQQVREDKRATASAS